MTATELAERRRALGLTQAQLAARLGVDHSTIHRWEHAKQTVPAWLDAALWALEHGYEEGTR